VQITKEQLKFIGGALIIIAACSVMFKEMFAYIFSLGRMFTLIGIALAIALVMTLLMVRLKGKKSAHRPADASKNSESDLNSNTDAVDAENVDGEGI